MKKLTDIIKEQEMVPSPITGNLPLAITQISDILSMADDLYNTLSELESIDVECEIGISNVYTALDDVYVMIDQKYEITPSQYDVDSDGIIDSDSDF